MAEAPGPVFRSFEEEIDFEGDAAFFRDNLELNVEYRVKFPVTASTKTLQRYVDGLREAGLDIGRGAAEFGYWFPFSDSVYQDGCRVLAIERRR